MSVSRTSQAVAMTRAGFARPHSADGDPLAQQRLCAGMPAVVLTAMEASLAARTAFFDGQVTGAIAGGPRPATDQVVILGAGYDDRALRFRSPGVTFFELDHPDTQADKRRRLAAILGGAESRSGSGPVLVAADFGRDDVPEVLRDAGHDATRATLFVCEGLLVYLDQPTTVRFLSGVRAAASDGSVLAASLTVHAEGLDSATVVARGNARRRTAGAEPFRTILPASDQAGLLAAAGWRITASVDAAELGTGAEPGRSLLVTAVPQVSSAQP
ncbi:MAG TPA: SAM-dependent methyltransferase [Streptosporangiaceae bacterium]|nr:SAM-dependent methyltransferase [Streptosporangiaceae bacterium]